MWEAAALVSDPSPSADILRDLRKSLSLSGLQDLRCGLVTVSLKEDNGCKCALEKIRCTAVAGGEGYL